EAFGADPRRPLRPTPRVLVDGPGPAQPGRPPVGVRRPGDAGDAPGRPREGRAVGQGVPPRVCAAPREPGDGDPQSGGLVRVAPERGTGGVRAAHLPGSAWEGSRVARPVPRGAAGPREVLGPGRGVDHGDRPLEHRGHPLGLPGRPAPSRGAPGGPRRLRLAGLRRASDLAPPGDGIQAPRPGVVLAAPVALMPETAERTTLEY